MALVTFVLSAGLDTYTAVLGYVSWLVGFAIVLVISFVGILFDLIGIAAAAASEVPFHAMAAERVFGANVAIRIVRNAGRFTSFCSDVIGDIAGILSGAATAGVAAQLALFVGVGEGVLRGIIVIGLTAFVAALTVGGKAIGKTLAIRFPTEIILLVSRIVGGLERLFRIEWFNAPLSRRRKRGDRHVIGKHS